VAADSRPRLTGVIPVLAMPFAADESIDHRALRKQARWALDAGVHGLALALASEFPRLSADERNAATETVLEEVAGSVPVVVHAGAESDALAIQLARAAEQRGAAAVMVPPPRFEVQGRSATAEFYRRLLSSMEAAVVLQDLPDARVDAVMAADLAAEFPGRVTLKVEVAPTPIAVRDAVERSGGALPVFGGAGGLLFVSELLRGATGTMPGCVFPEVFVETWRRFEAGDVDEARRAFAPALPFLVAATLPGRMLSLYREALVVRGVIPAAHGRCPDVELDDVDRAEVRALLSGMG
jgi:dihydrodipicolinate synthase/N-acetylneuraminate lyase